MWRAVYIEKCTYGSGARNTETFCRKTEKALDSLAYYISELLGKETIDTNTYGQTKGKSGSYSTNFQQSGRELLMPDEVRLLDNDYALLFVRGEHAVMDRKYDLLKHPNIRDTEDGGAPPYDYAEAPLAHDVPAFDGTRYEDYELLSGEDIAGEPF